MPVYLCESNFSWIYFHKIIIFLREKQILKTQQIVLFSIVKPPDNILCIYFPETFTAQYPCISS